MKLQGNSNMTGFIVPLHQITSHTRKVSPLSQSSFLSSRQPSNRFPVTVLSGRRGRILTSCNIGSGLGETTPENTEASSAPGQDATGSNIEASYDEYVKQFELETSMSYIKWRHISFKTIQEELDAIDEYVKAEKLPDDDPWPKFLRGAAYEYWGQPSLALAQYALTKNANGLRLIPDIWERRAYNAFKIGEVVAANLYFEKARKLSTEAEGNMLHISHWFYENFENFIPKQNGPMPAIQHAICMYCFGKLQSTREMLVSPIAIQIEGVEHALLFMMATSFRLDPANGLSKGDIALFDGVLKSNREWDQRLGLLVLLFTTAGQLKKKEQEQYFTQISRIIEDEAPHIDITTHTYMALYHDAFTRDVVKRDDHLDKVSSLSSSIRSYDTENYLFHVAKNRLSIPDGAKMASIPELID